MRKVRTTINPNETIEITEQEYTDLSRQGLIADEPESKPDTDTPTTPKSRRTDQ